MKLYQIEYLLAVGKHGSISRAAEELLVSRPAVSRAVKDLEDEFGMTLLVRTTTGVVLTQAGQLVYEKCKKFEQLLTELHTEIGALRCGEGQQRQLHIGISYTARSRSAPFLAAFRQAHPDIFLQLTDLTEAFIDTGTLVPDYDLEIALTEDRPYEGVDFLDMDESSFVFCCSVSHPLAQRGSVSIMDIRSEPLGGVAPMEDKPNQVSQLFARCGVTPNIVYTTMQVSFLQQMVRDGLCCTVKPRQSLTPDPGIALIPIDEAPRLRLRILWSNSSHHSSAFDDFLKFASRTLQQSQGSGGSGGK